MGSPLRMAKSGLAMKSISERLFSRKSKYTVAHGGIQSFRHGCKIALPRLVKIPSSAGANASKRGEINSFSAKAVRRLRLAILTTDLPDYLTCGLTLTLPWEVSGSMSGDLLSAYKSAFHDFGVAFTRRFPASVAVFRHELQTRGAAHSHLLLWLAPADVAPFSVTANQSGKAARPVCNSSAGSRASLASFQDVRAPAKRETGTVGALRSCEQAADARLAQDLATQAFPALHGAFLQMWGNALKNTGVPVTRRAAAGFRLHGVRLQAVRGLGQMTAYLADHATKHKQAQLGYPGKQWGIIGRKNRTPDHGGAILPDPVTPYEMRILELYARYTGRLTRYRDFTLHAAKRRAKRLGVQFSGVPFGPLLPKWGKFPFRYRSRRSACGVRWLSEDAQYRLFALACEQAAAECFTTTTNQEQA